MKFSKENRGTDKIQQLADYIDQSYAILVIGTNGYYSSAYWNYRRDDAVIVQINPGHTGFDRCADLNIREGCDDVFRKLMDRWGGKTDDTEH